MALDGDRGWMSICAEPLWLLKVHIHGVSVSARVFLLEAIDLTVVRCQSLVVKRMGFHCFLRYASILLCVLSVSGLSALLMIPS